MKMISHATTVDEDGKILGVFNNASLDVIEANNHGSIVFDTPQQKTDYWDFSLCLFVSIGIQPSPHHIFDYHTKQWTDPRTLDEIKAQKWSEIKAMRNQLEFGGFEFEGNTYDSDQVSQGRIMGASSSGVDQTWTLADNTTVELSASQLQQLYAALQAHIASVHERGRIARQLIFDAETKEQVEEINL